MRRVVLPLCFLSAALGCAPAPIPEAPIDARPPPPDATTLLESERYELDNGLDVVLHVDRSLPLVAVDLTYHVGSMHDGVHPGLAHLAEHLMFRGSRHVDDGELQAKLQKAGGHRTNASTFEDRTSYTTLIPGEQLPLALWLESDRMEHVAPMIDAKRVDEEKKTTTDEWRTRIEARTRGRDLVALTDALFPSGHPYRRADPDAIAELGEEDVRDFLERYYGPANATLVLAGDLPDDTRAQIGRYFAHRSGSEAPVTPWMDLPIADEDRRVVRRSEFSRVPMVVMSWPTPGWLEPGDAAADLVARAFTVGALRILQENGGRVLSAWAEQRSRARQSAFQVVVVGRGDVSLLELEKLLLAQLEGLRSRPFGPDALASGKRFYKLERLRELETIQARAQKIQHYIALGKPEDSLAIEEALHDAVDDRGATAFIADFLVPDRQVTLLAYPAGDER